MFAALRRILIGKRLPTRHARHERLPKILALPVFASDVLSSSAYATEEIVLILWMAGASALTLSVPIALVILTLLAIVTLSYRQTIYAYPGGGGAFSVALENLGVWWGLAAAAALLIGYVLTVAVSIAAGAAAITSAIPTLLPYKVHLCLVFIAFITLANLRGVRESGTLFAPPTYGFVAIILFLILVGLWKYVTGQITVSSPPTLGEPLPLTAFLVLTAFARGCAALTGTEAISNGVQAFKPPESRNAAATLAWMGIILGTLFFGITLLARLYGAVPRLDEHGHVVETLVSQIARMVFEGTPLAFFYYLVQGATMLILVLAANTAYQDFPRLSSILAREGFAPRQLANLGDRLVFSNGILVLGLFSALLILYYGGSTHALIPLYALGVFLAFTFSQAGMAVRWWRLRPPNWFWSFAINGIGAITTTLVFVTQLVVNFLAGAWAVFVALLGLMLVFHKINTYYRTVSAQLAIGGNPSIAPKRHRVLILVPRVDKGVASALEYALTIAEPEEIEAVHVNLDSLPSPIYRRVLKRYGKEAEPQLYPMTPAVAKLREQWLQWAPDIPITILDSEYRSLTEPILEYIDEVLTKESLDLVTVIIPEFHPTRWWHHLLHNQSGLMLKLALLGKPKVVVTNVRYFLER